MYKLHTKKQLAYFDKAVRLYNEKGYNFEQISRILPVSSTTVSDWIRIFACENGKPDTKMKSKHPKSHPSRASEASGKEQADVAALQRRIAQLERELLDAEIRAEFLDEMINVAESMFNIPIRKKAGARQ